MPLDEIEHGTEKGYSSRKCRCELCKSAHRDHHRALRAERLAMLEDVDGVLTATYLPDDRHGRDATYTVYGCRCEDCRIAHRMKSSSYRKKDSEE